MVKAFLETWNLAYILCFPFDKKVNFCKKKQDHRIWNLTHFWELISFTFFKATFVVVDFSKLLVLYYIQCCQLKNIWYSNYIFLLSKWKNRSSGNTGENAINYTMAMFILDVHQVYGFFCTMITLCHLPKTLSEIGLKCFLWWHLLQFTIMAQMFREKWKKINFT